MSKEIIYVAQRLKMTVCVPMLDEDGKKIPVIDPITSNHVRINKKPQYYEESISFTNVIKSVSKGLLSQYKVTADTPKSIRDRLAELSNDPKSGVLTKEAWIKLTNPDQFKEIERRKELENKLREEYEVKLESARKEGLEEGIKTAGQNATEDLKAKKQELSNTKGALTKTQKLLEEANRRVKELEDGAK